MHAQNGCDMVFVIHATRGKCSEKTFQIELMPYKIRQGIQTWTSQTATGFMCLYNSLDKHIHERREDKHTYLKV